MVVLYMVVKYHSPYLYQVDGTSIQTVYVDWACVVSELDCEPNCELFEVQFRGFIFV